LRGLALIVAAAAALGSACAATAGGYRVRAGDTLTAIAQNQGTSVAVLERLNRLAPGDTLLAGSVLRLPRPAGAVQRYTVRPGETLTGIAVRYGTTAAAIARESGRKIEQTLVIGTVLRVPVARRAAIPARAERYTTRPGDSLSAIAMRYGVSLGALAALNHLRLDRPLWVGVRLKLPAQTLAHATEAFDRSTVRGSLVYWANHYGVDPRLATALAWMESGFNNSLVSPIGAVGVMQITPDTWDYVEQVLLLGQRVPHDADGNVRVGVALLHHLLNVYGGDVRRTLAAYYQGPRSLQENGFLPGTDLYVADILALRERF
jgi:N-acetylmuramoyl-L-alanine amidase